MPASIENLANGTNCLPLIKPTFDDGRIAFATAMILQKWQYSQQPFNEEVSDKFFDRYLEAVDPQRLHFLQSDVAGFEHYRDILDRLTLTDQQVADVRPACEIFDRFLQRLQQRVEYVDELLKTQKFTFDTDERILINRKDLPYPADLAAAQRLWKERLRYEYLQELLGKTDAKKKAEAAAAQPAATNAAEKKTGSKPKSDAEEIVETLSRRHHRTLRAYEEYNHDDVLQVYLSALARVYDPHSDYLGHAQFEQFAIQMNLSLFGIGAQLRSDDGYCVIERLLPGGPAIKCKQIEEKDRIIEVAQSNQPPVDIVEMSLTKAVQLIRGPKGTEVRLTLIPAGADASSHKVVTLVRDEIPIEDGAAKAKIIDMPDGQGSKLRLGVIDLPSFYAPFNPANSKNEPASTNSTSADVATLLRKLEAENVKGVILDLRHNGGGSLEEAIKLTGLFIKEGPVVQVKDSIGNIQVDEDTDPSVVYDGPLVVLTSRFSASASEIVAGALQDYGRALLVGDVSTHGKGTVQSVNPLQNWMRKGYTNDPGAVKVTIKTFYRASGITTQKKGVTPDIVLPSVWNEAKDIGESSLDNALECKPISSAKYEALNLVTPFLPELRHRSAERTARDPEFAYVREDAEQLKKAQEDKTVSLNEQARLKEQEKNEARAEERNKERRARKPVEETIYDLPLKVAVKPGLPPPEQQSNSVAEASSSKISLDPSQSVANPASPATPPAGVKGSKDGLSAGLAAHATAGARPGSALKPAHPGGETEAEKAPAVPDITLQETEHILADYIGVFPKQNVLTAEH
jgi:carboxyl-terminal processing protease